MTDSSKAKYLRIKTNWIVFTGAPNAGKTTILNRLNKRGFQVVPEAARYHIEEKKSEGMSVEQIRGNESEFQKFLLSQKIAIADSLNANALTILDRGVPDSVTYYRLAGLEPGSAIPDTYKYRYRKIFLFESLPYIKDSARTESTHQAELIGNWLKKDYEDLGYEPILVPVMSVEQRIDFILEEIGHLND